MQSGERLSNLLGAAATALTDRTAQDLVAASGVALTEATALATLSSTPGQSVEQMRRRLALTHSGGVRLTDRLVAAGLVIRARPETGDRRTVRLHLTDRGRYAARQALAARAGVAEQALSTLDAEQRSMMTLMLENVLGQLSSSILVRNRICRLCDEAVCEQDGACCPAEAGAR